MHFGNSPEEAELAGEEIGFGGLGKMFKGIGRKALKATEIVTAVPGGKALLTVMPFGVPLLVASEGAKAIKNVKGAAGLSKAKTPSKPVEPIATKALSNGTAAQLSDGLSGMGAAAPMSDDDIERLINRETNPAKKYRMILSFERARRSRQGRR
jgi:hypothetical protein